MTFKPLLILALTLGLAQCKTSRVQNGADLSDPIGSSGESSVPGLSPEVQKLLLTGPEVDAQNLGINSLKASTFLVDNQVLVVVEAEPGAGKPDYAHYKICQGDDCSVFQEANSFWSVEWLVPAGKKGDFKIFARACAIPSRVGNPSELLGNCGREASTYVKVDRANKPSDAAYAKLKRRQEVIQKMRATAQRLQAPAQAYIAWFEGSESHSDEEGVLYAAAKNLTNAPVLMADLFATRILEEVAESAKAVQEGQGGLNLAESRVAVPEIRDSINCRAAGHEWDQPARTCYKKAKSDSKKKDGSVTLTFDKKWFDAKTQIGGSLLLIAGVAAYQVQWGNDFNALDIDTQVGKQKFFDSLDDVSKTKLGNSEFEIKNLKLEKGKYKFNGEELNKNLSFGTEGKRMAILGAGVAGFILTVIGLSEGNRLADGSGGPVENFQQAADAAQNVLAPLKKEFYALDKELFGRDL